MPRRPRQAPGGLIYHVLNRAVARAEMFHKPADYDAFERVLAEAHRREPMRVLAYCLMPNHWHLVLWPNDDGQLSSFMRWLTHTHTQRYHAHYHTSGTGHLYQGRFKSFVVQEDAHLLRVCRYVERNALRANLVVRAEEWRWSSLWRRTRGDEKAKALLHPWPLPEPADWIDTVNQPESETELSALRRSLRRGCPLGEETWVKAMVQRLGLEFTLRPPGRPRKVEPVEAIS